LYWDMAHPTAAGHRVIADVADETLTAIPELSTWAMIAIGFVALGFASWGARRARASAGRLTSTIPMLRLQRPSTAIRLSTPTGEMQNRPE
jgi:phospholipase/lecithinase/hemolysin